MINNLNISNLQVFNKEGYSLPCTTDRQEKLQTGIAKKIGKLLNAEGFLALIPNFDPTEETKLRIHLTKDGITIQLLERDTNNLKADRSYSENNQLVTDEIRTRKQKIITKVDSLFKEPPSFDSSTKLESEKIRPLFIPSQPSKDEQIPFTIGFDATLSNPQIQQLHAKIEGLQDQLNKKIPHSEELQVIKEQLAFLSQAIHNLSSGQEHTTYPHTEEYALINKLVDSQRDIYRALLDLLSKNLNQSPITPLTPSPAQGIENSALKEMIFKLQQEKTDLEKTREDLESTNITLQNDLRSKNKQMAALEQQIQDLPTNETLNQLQSQLKTLENEKVDLQSQISAKDEEISELNKETQHLSEVYQALQNQLKDEKELSSILEIAAIPEMSDAITSINTTIEEAEKTMEQDLASLENSTIPEGLLTPSSGYYTLTATPSLEESETSTEITTLQAKINTLQEELEDIRPIAYGNTSRIEKMEKSNKALALELSEKTKTIENLEEEKTILEGLLDKSESQVKELKIAQYQLKEQQKKISISSEENNDLLAELEKIHEQLSSEKRKRAELEQAHENQLEKLKTLYDENTLEKMDRMNAKILAFQEQQKNVCLTLARVIADYINSKSITEDIGQNIFKLIEEAFNTTGYKTLLDLVSSDEEDLASSEEEGVSSDEYNEDSYMI